MMLMMLMMVWAYVFVALLNSGNHTRQRAAMAFAFIQGINVFLTNPDYFYYFGASAGISLLVYTIYQSRQDWALLLGGIVLSSTIINLLGILNFNQWHSATIRDSIDIATIVTTIAELIILAFMSSGKLDRNRDDILGGIRISLLRTFLPSFNISTDKAVKS